LCDQFPGAMWFVDCALWVDSQTTNFKPHTTSLGSGRGVTPALGRDYDTSATSFARSAACRSARAAFAAATSEGAFTLGWPRTSRRRMRFCSPWNTTGSSSRRRFLDAPLCRNWWLLCDFRRVIFPVPVILNRFAAVLFVFSFGIL